MARENTNHLQKLSSNWSQGTLDHKLLFTLETHKSGQIQMIRGMTTFCHHPQRVRFHCNLDREGPWKTNKESKPEWPLIRLVSANPVKQPPWCMFMPHPATPPYCNFLNFQTPWKILYYTSWYLCDLTVHNENNQQNKSTHSCLINMWFYCSNIPCTVFRLWLTLHLPVLSSAKLLMTPETVTMDLRGREETGGLNLIQLCWEKVTFLQVSLIFVAQWCNWIIELLQGMKKVICEM